MKRTISALILFIFSLIIILSGCSDSSSKLLTDTKTDKEVTVPTEKKKTLDELIELSFDPNPVLPNTTLTIKVVLKPFREDEVEEGNLEILKNLKKITILIPGASSASKTSLPIEDQVPGLEGTYFWFKAQDKVELIKIGENEWTTVCVSPTDECLYDATVKIESESKSVDIKKPGWIMKVFPAGWESSKAFSSLRDAIESELQKEFSSKGVEFKIVSAEEKSLLPDDRRNPNYLKLYYVTFEISKDVEYMRKGRNSYFFYLLKESPDGGWKVLSVGSGP